MGPPGSHRWYAGSVGGGVGIDGTVDKQLGCMVGAQCETGRLCLETAEREELNRLRRENHQLRLSGHERERRSPSDYRRPVVPGPKNVCPHPRPVAHGRTRGASELGFDPQSA
jgi:hypothetical protein